jgi:hypothetical protein
MKIFVINGYPGAGKNLFTSLCNQHANVFVQDIITSDPVKRAFQELGWKGEKTPEIRDGMALMMEVTNKLFDTSFNYVNRELNKLTLKNQRDDSIWAFIHCREPENIKRYVDAYDAKTVYIARASQRPGPEIVNKSDKNVAYYKYDYIIDNNYGIPELQEEVKKFVYKIWEDK